MDTTADFTAGIDAYVEHGFVQLDEVKLHFVEAGAEDAPLVVLLHGFPEFWYSWRHQIAPLVEAGYRVVVPDQRGYNTSDKPDGVSSYSVESLAADIDQLIAAFGYESAYVIGHDWGGMVAWMMPMLHPERVERVVIMNVPHPDRMLKGLRTLGQMKKSWYMLLFQIPGLAEKLLPRNDWKALRDVFREQPVRPSTFSESEINRYVDAIARPGALKSAINWYRAAARKVLSPPLQVIEHPTLVIWGTQDAMLGEELAEPPSKWVKNYRVEKIHDASHWVQCDAPERVNALLLHFLASS